MRVHFKTTVPPLAKSHIRWLSCGRLHPPRPPWNYSGGFQSFVPSIWVCAKSTILGPRRVLFQPRNRGENVLPHITFVLGTDRRPEIPRNSWKEVGGDGVVDIKVI